MKLISHRGNLNGPDLLLDNNPNHIEKVLSMGIECEIDVWFCDEHYYLGHDGPLNKIPDSFLLKNGLWCHAKNLQALESMLNKNIHCFWHENDDFTLTSRGYIWTFPEKSVVKKSIIVDNSIEWKNKNYNCFAICSDYILI